MHVEEYCQQVKRCIKIASNCIEVDRKKRPTIGHIINELETETVICEPFPEESSSESTVEERSSAEEEEVQIKFKLFYHFLFFSNLF